MSIAKSTLKKDTILVNVTGEFIECPIDPIPPSFESEIEPIVLELGKFTEYTLPAIVEGTSSLTSIDFKPDNRISSLFHFEPTTLKVTFNGQDV